MFQYTRVIGFPRNPSFGNLGNVCPIGQTDVRKNSSAHAGHFGHHSGHHAGHKQVQKRCSAVGGRKACRFGTLLTGPRKSQAALIEVSNLQFHRYFVVKKSWLGLC